MGRPRNNVVQFAKRGRRGSLRSASSATPLARRSSFGFRGLLLGAFAFVAIVVLFDRPSEDQARAPAATQRASSAGIADPGGSTRTVVGRASTVDGDTLVIRGQHIRLNGIDAPESGQICRNSKGGEYGCGSKATRQLDAILAKSRPTSCKFVDWDSYGRMVANCYRADGKSVAALMVESGHALDWPRHSNGAYAKEQAAAQQQRLGMWQGEFAEPWDWGAS